MALKTKFLIFCNEYLACGNASAAAKKAGYTESHCGQIGSTLLKRTDIQEYIAAKTQERMKATAVTQDYVLSVIQETIERCRQSEPVRDRKGNQVFTETPDGDIVPAYTFDSGGVLKGTELLGKYLAMFTDKTLISMGVRPDMKALGDMSPQDVEEEFSNMR